MSLRDEIDAALADKSAGEPPMVFEITDEGRTMNMRDRKTGDLQAQFTALDGHNFNHMTLEQVMTVVFGGLEQAPVQPDTSPENPSIGVVRVELPPTE